MRAEDADLPLLAHDDPAFTGERFHEVLDDLASRGWLACSDLGYLVLGREPGFGAHFCAGASLARAEIIEALASLAPPRAPPGARWRACLRHADRDLTMRSLPVRFTPHEPG